jgi:hypothetical protein
MAITEPRLYVYFTAPPLRAALRCPVTLMAQALTMSRLSHVAVGDAWVVCDPAVTGTVYWPRTEYVLEYPTLYGFFEVAVAAAPDLDRWQGGRTRMWPAFWYGATGGRTRSRNCVSVVRDVLKEAGVEAPPIGSPRSLHRWLMNSVGAQWHALSP